MFLRAVSATGGGRAVWDRGGVGRARVRAAPGGWGRALRERIVRGSGRVVGSTAPRPAAARGGRPGARGISPHISFGLGVAAAPQDNEELPLPGDCPAAGRCAAAFAVGPLWRLTRLGAPSPDTHEETSRSAPRLLRAAC